MSRRSKLRCTEVAILTVLLPGMIAFLLPALGGGRHPRTLSCANRLSQLYKLGTAYAASHRGRWPDAEGERLWTSFATGQAPLVDASQIEILFCPVKGEEIVPGASDYRGPAGPVAKVREGDPLGADKPDNHGDGGNVLRMDGSVVEYGPDDPAWRRCAEALRP